MRCIPQLILFFLYVVSANASTGEIYGYGSSANALGNTMLGGSRDSFATFYNAAANSKHPGLFFSYGLSFARPSFQSIDRIVVENDVTSSNDTDVYGAIDNENYLDHLSQNIAASFNFGENLKQATLGLTASMPLLRLGYLDTGEPFKPDYLSYRSRTQRPQIYLSASMALLEHLYVAAGLSIATNLAGSTNVFSTGSSSKVSHQRFASTIKPKVSPYFSIHYEPGAWETALTVRMPNRYKLSIDTSARANLLVNTNDIPLVFASSSTLYYDPLEVDLGVSYQFSPRFWGTVEVDWMNYSVFESPILSVANVASGPIFRDSLDTTPDMQNIFILKTGFELQKETTRWRLGYFYRPSPIASYEGPGNLVDPEQHVITAGLGFDLQAMKILQYPVKLDVHAQYHHLVEKHITKSPGNELGNAAKNKVGYPGYDIGGHILGGGFSLSMNF